jgi:hypothetical protein
MKQQNAFLWCICLMLVVSNVHAQRYFGIATSEWNDVNSIYLNPANIAGSHEKISVGIISFNLGVDNNLGTFSSIGNIGNSLNSNGGTNSLFSNSGQANFSMIVPSGEVRGPSIIVKINSKQSIAFTTRIRVINQLNNFDQSLFNTITNPSFTPNSTYTVKAQNFNWTAHLWSEAGLTYSVILAQDDRNQLKAGATLRYLGGIGYLALKGNNLDLNYSSGKDSFYAANSDLQYTSNVVSTRSAIFNGINTSDLLGNFFGSNQGSGVGADLGFVYSFNPGGGMYSEKYNPGQGYKLKFSASVTDLGSINYKAQNNSTVIVTGNGYITGNGLKNNVKNASDFRNYIVNQGFTGDTTARSTRIFLPSALLLSGDYNVYQKFFVNATYINNLANRQSFGNSYYNQVTLTPRYDTKLITVGLPITYSMLANDLKMGIGFRISGFFVGSDDMLALFSNHQYGFGFYMGGYIPLFTKTNTEG